MNKMMFMIKMSMVKMKTKIRMREITKMNKTFMKKMSEGKK